MLNAPKRNQSRPIENYKEDRFDMRSDIWSNGRKFDGKIMGQFNLSNESVRQFDRLALSMALLYHFVFPWFCHLLFI